MTGCVICLEALFAPYVLPCGHQFHEKCIRKWFAKQINVQFAETMFLTIFALTILHELRKYSGTLLQIATDVAFMSENIAHFRQLMAELNPD